MTLEFFRIEQHKSLEERLRATNISPELLESLGVDNNFSGLPLDHYSKGNSSVTISPKRGVTIPSLILNGKEIFYNDPARRNDLKQTSREGHRMWPQAGRFNKKDMLDYGYNLEQHGFLRDTKWTKKNPTASEDILYTLQSSQQTLNKFPHHFNAVQTIELEKDQANISLYIQNTGERGLHSTPGHHTYYKINPNQKKNIELDDNLKVTKQMKEKRISGEETIIVPNPGRCKMRIPGTGEIETYYDPKFKYIRLRSEKEKGFVCIEPVVDETKYWLQSAILTQPGEIMNVGFSIKLLSKDMQ